MQCLWVMCLNRRMMRHTSMQNSLCGSRVSTNRSLEVQGCVGGMAIRVGGGLAWWQEESFHFRSIVGSWDSSRVQALQQGGLDFGKTTSKELAGATPLPSATRWETTSCVKSHVWLVILDLICKLGSGCVHLVSVVVIKHGSRLITLAERVWWKV